ncbi:hypothetical protein BDW72DRAFT_43918 [Aspergillus terricola var. indicus]
MPGLTQLSSERLSENSRYKHVSMRSQGRNIIYIYYHCTETTCSVISLRAMRSILLSVAVLVCLSLAVLSGGEPHGPPTSPMPPKGQAGDRNRPTRHSSPTIFSYSALKSIMVIAFCVKSLPC